MSKDQQVKSKTELKKMRETCALEIESNLSIINDEHFTISSFQ